MSLLKSRNCKRVWHLSSLFISALFFIIIEKAGASQDEFRKYEFLNSEAIYELSNELAEGYPEFVELTKNTGNKGKMGVGTIDDCPFSDENGCDVLVLTIWDKVRHPKNSYLPEVFIGGTLHGDEKVGPIVTMEFAALLLSAASCESYPRIEIPEKNAPSIVQNEYKDQLEESYECRDALRKRGVSSSYRKWMARLVSTRKITIVPTLNALGYFRDELGEDGIDPLYDFPFDRPPGDVTCMQSHTARVTNDLFRLHEFQIGISIHGGAGKGISFPWGAPSFDGFESPDKKAQLQIADAMSDYAGELHWSKGSLLPIGSINKLVGSMPGMMEDWAYGGSWAQDGNSNQTCHKNNYKGARVQPTDYGNRVMMFRLDLSSSSPPSSHLGTDIDLFSSKKTGHVARGIRVALLAADIAEPYVIIKSIDGTKIQDDIVPLRESFERSCIHTKSFQVPAKQDVTIEWKVGGSFEVVDTMIIYGKWDDFPDDVDGVNQPLSLIDFITNNNNILQTHNLQIQYFGSGSAKWGKEETKYSVQISIDMFEEGDLIAAFAVAFVDKDWTSQAVGDIKPSNLPQQSHLVNRRVNPNWAHSSSKSQITGQKYWFSVPVTLKLKPAGSKVLETSLRIPNPNLLQKVEKELELAEEKVLNKLFSTKGAFFVIATICLVAMSITFYNNWKKRYGNAYGNVGRVNYYHDDNATELQLS